MKTSYDRLAKIYTNCTGHMAKMATTPIYDKKPFNPSGPLVIQCSKHTDSSPHCFVLVNIRIPTGYRLLSVNVIGFNHILSRRNMIGLEKLNH